MTFNHATGIFQVGLAVTALLTVGCEQSVSETMNVAADQHAVLNGDPVDVEAQPWTNRIVHVNGGCTGTLINEEWVITAAHCTAENERATVSHDAIEDSVYSSYIFEHEDANGNRVDTSIIKLAEPLNPGIVGDLDFYDGVIADLIGEPVECFGYGWEDVDETAGHCETSADCDQAAGYYCATTKGEWCVKSSSILRKEAQTVHGLRGIDPAEFELKRNDDGQLTVPGDSGGPCAFADGTLVGVNRSFAFDLSTSYHQGVPSFVDWVETRMSCPLFNPNSFAGDFCTDTCVCDVGIGDCDTDSNCEGGLVCRQYSMDEAAYGLPNGYDICVDPACPEFDPLTVVFDPDPEESWDPGCKLSAGEGHCDGPEDCGGALICRKDAGLAIHRDADPRLGICVFQPAPGCSKNVCTPSCPCDIKEGNCTDDADCRPGLVCGKDMGGLFGKAPDVDVCVKPEALTPTLFSFDEPGDWTSEQADVSVVEIDGRTALSVSGGGWIEIDSREFETVEMLDLPRRIEDVQLLLDIRLAEPVNPWWQGEIAVSASCPTQEVYNRWMDQSLLTGLEPGAFHTVSFDIPEDIMTVWWYRLHSCTISLFLNVGENGGTYYLDSLRFADEIPVV